MGPSEHIVVLDDDPTGVQTLAGVTVLLGWDAARIRGALDDHPAVHLITNTRALHPGAVRPLVTAAARTAVDGVPDAQLVLRGDSTLRGHVREEYVAVRDVIAPDAWPVLLLVPALPSAGRVTVEGVHLLERGGSRVPVSDTEFAQDGVFAYSSARLLDWAEERTDGLFAASRGREVHLAALRDGGGGAVAGAILDAGASAHAAAVAVDAETTDDLEVAAEGYRAAVAAGARAIVRCAPAFAGVLCGTAASENVELPTPRAGLLLVCGSYVAQTTRQLRRLLADRPGALVEADVHALADGNAHAESSRLAAAASRLLERDGFAVLATPRVRPPETTSLAAGERIARGLARSVAEIEPRPSVVVAKGGITSALVLREGLGSDEASVVGPVVPGVSRWLARWPDGSPVDYIVVPGNVGGDELLAGLVDGMLGASARC